MSSDLKPCPFCGSEAELKWETLDGCYRVRCSKCPSASPRSQCDSKAAAAWNTRAPCPECDRQRERANEAERRMDSMRQEVMTRYQLRAELAKALGVEQLTSNDQVEAALERVAALEAVAVAAREVWLDLTGRRLPVQKEHSVPLVEALRNAGIRGDWFVSEAALDAQPQQGQEGDE